MANKQPKCLYNYDDDEDYVPTKKVKYSFRDEKPLQHKKHTLDSDEEEEDDDEKAERKKQEILDDEDIDGQEDATIDFEGETKITPFNMKEEMEEGYFDKDGFYHFKKDSDLLKDAWLDDIDWVKVKRQDDVKKYGSDVEESDDEEPRLPGGDEARKDKEFEIGVYKEILQLLKPGEEIARALKRLGGKTKRLTSAEKWKLKKQGKLDSITGGDMVDLNKLTDLANEIIITGNMDIYQETYEMINLKIKRHEAASDPVASEPSLDMFSDDVTSHVTQQVPTQKDDKDEKDAFEEVKWEYRLKNEEGAEIHGPFTTEKMIRFKESDQFKDRFYVRKTTEQSGPWYLSSRIDFELYV